MGEPPERASGVIGQRFRAVTAAALLMRATDVIRLRGFDPLFVNGMEDVDLCLRAGREPAFVVECGSVVVHRESQTPGRWRHIEANRGAFLARWQGRLPPAELWRWPRVGLDVVAIEEDRATSPPRSRSCARSRRSGRTDTCLGCCSTVGISKPESSALQVMLARRRDEVSTHGWVSIEARLIARWPGWPTRPPRRGT